MNAIRSVPLALALLLSGCAGGVSRLLADVPDAQKPARSVAIALDAAPSLNANAKGQPLALVTRIYKLRQRAAFDQAPFDTFLDPQKEHAAFGADLLEVKEVTLVPGQHYRIVEKVNREAGFVGVVALFHAPAANQWRLSFVAADAERAGLTLAAQACALHAGALNPRAPARCQ